MLSRLIAIAFAALPSRSGMWLSGARVAALGLCVLMPAAARAQEVEWTQRNPSPRYSHALSRSRERGLSLSARSGRALERECEA